MPKARVLMALGALVSALLLTACASSSGEEARGEIIVSAASSLTDAFEEVAAEFEAREGVVVTLNLGASSALAAQIAAGAPTDVFASADLDQMRGARDAGYVEAPVEFATNALVVAVPAGSEVVQGFEDLAKPGVRLVIAGREVPAGRYAREMLARATSDGRYGEDFGARVLANVRSEEANVRAVLAKVQLGEADAGIVYRTDLAAAEGEVRAIEVPAEVNVRARYPIAPVSSSEAAEAAQAFVAFVLSEQGQAILQAHGFGPPEGA